MKKSLKKLPMTTEELEKIIVLQKKIIDEQRHEIISYKERYVRLLEEIKLKNSHRFGPSSEKSSLQSDLFDEPGVELPDELKAQLDDETHVAGYTRKKHPTRRPLPHDIPRETVVHDISESEKICECGAPLVSIGEEITEQLNYIPAQLSIIQHVRPKYACKPCQGNVKIAPMPTLLLPKSIATPNLVSHTIINKYCDHVPLYRQEAIWARLDIDMPRSSLCGWLMKVSELCTPLIVEMSREMIKLDYLQADETTVQVLNEVGRDNRTKSYMWVYRGGGDKPTIIYDYQPTRGGYHAETFLSGFKGYLQTDAYSGYNFAANDKNIIQIGCMAHARRKFADIIKITTSHGLAHQAMKFFRALYAVEKTARDNALSAEARHRLRQEKALPVLNELKTWLDCHLTKIPEQSKIGDTIRYVLSNWIRLNNYLKDGRIEIDNNLAENAIRPFALGRKNWLFMGSEKGAKAGALFYSLIETCKANHIEPYRYFCVMLPRIRLCKTDDDYRQLLPQYIEL